MEAKVSVTGCVFRAFDRRLGWVDNHHHTPVEHDDIEQIENLKKQISMQACQLNWGSSTRVEQTRLTND